MDPFAVVSEAAEIASLPFILFTTWLMGASGMLDLPWKMAVLNTRRWARKWFGESLP